MQHGETLFSTVLGPQFEQLPNAVRKLHQCKGVHDFTGKCDITCAANLPGRIVAHFAGLPTRTAAIEIAFRLQVDQDGETWTRQFGASKFQTRLSLDRYQSNPCLCEAKGPLRAKFKLSLRAQRLVWQQIRISIFGLPLLGVLQPDFHAVEWDEAGVYQFDVDLGLPLIGRLIRYRGYLVPKESSKGA